MSDPQFFLDRGLGARTVPEGLRAAGWTIVTMDELYGVNQSQTISDVQWISETAAGGFVGISKDRNIARVGIEVDAVIGSGARLLLLPNAHFTARQMLARLLSHERAIRRLVNGDDGPWITVVQQGGLQRLDLQG